MGWTRYAVIAVITTVMFTMSWFGGHFGYTVHGAPKGGLLDTSQPPWKPVWGYYMKASTGEITYYTSPDMCSDVAYCEEHGPIGYWNTETNQFVKYEEAGGLGFGDAVSFLWYALSFQIDDAGMLSIFFWICAVLILFILLSFVPFIGGG